MDHEDAPGLADPGLAVEREAEALTLHTIADPGAALLDARGPLAGARLGRAGTVGVPLREPTPGWYVQPTLDARVQLVGRAVWNVDYLDGVLVEGTWWIRQAESAAGWEGEPPAGAVRGTASQLVRGERTLVFDREPGGGITWPTTFGRCALDLDTSDPGAPTPSLVDLVTGDVAAMPEGGLPIALGP